MSSWTESEGDVMNEDELYDVRIDRDDMENELYEVRIGGHQVLGPSGSTEQSHKIQMCMSEEFMIISGSLKH